MSTLAALERMHTEAQVTEYRFTWWAYLLEYQQRPLSALEALARSYPCQPVHRSTSPAAGPLPSTSGPNATDRSLGRYIPAPLSGGRFVPRY